MKTLVEIKFENHDYTATIAQPGQLEKFLSEKNQPFTIGNISGDFHEMQNWLIPELNRIKNFGQNTKNAAK